MLWLVKFELSIPGIKTATFERNVEADDFETAVLKAKHDLTVVKMIGCTVAVDSSPKLELPEYKKDENTAEVEVPIKLPAPIPVGGK